VNCGKFKPIAGLAVENWHYRSIAAADRFRGSGPRT
jgi:hypothetical protein